MHVYLEFFGHKVASYGFFIALGGIIVNLIAVYIFSKRKMDINDFTIIESIGLLGAFIGAKALYLFVSFKDIEWSRITNLSYLAQLMQTGFVFYGGFIGGIIAAIIASKANKIDFRSYADEVIFLVPLAHAFGRVGCFMAGCCYGMPYDGPFSVVFPENSFAIHGVKLFPVQLFEAAGLVITCLLLLLLKKLLSKRFQVEFYLILYGVLRLITERYRYDAARGSLFGISTSQWISIFMIIIGLASIGIQLTKSKSKDCLTV